MFDTAGSLLPVLIFDEAAAGGKLNSPLDVTKVEKRGSGD
jgi:hypothetical protein